MSRTRRGRLIPMPEPTWLDTIPETDGPSLALSSALRYVIAAHRSHATDDHGRLFGAATQHAIHCGATRAQITAALTEAHR